MWMGFRDFENSLFFPQIRIDLFSASGHKVYAPKGVGLLAVKKGVRLVPLLTAGTSRKICG